MLPEPTNNEQTWKEDRHMRLRRPSGFAGFTTLWFGQVLSALGTRMTNFAISIWVWQQTGNATDLAMLVFFAFGATVLFSPIAGALVDRWDRKLTLALSDAGAAAATATLLVLFLTGSAEVWHLYVVNFVIGAFMAFQIPAYSATITVMMEKGRYPRANAMMFAVRSAPVIFAPGLAAAVLSWTSIEAILAADVASCALGILAVVIVKMPPMPRVADIELPHIWQDCMHGFRYMRQCKPLVHLEAVMFAINLFAAVGFVLLIPMILARGGSSIELGVVQTIGAVGGVAGVVMLSSLKPTRHKMFRMLIAMVAFSVLGRILYGVGNEMIAWAIALLFVHYCIPFIDGYAQSIWQEKVEPAAQGRVFGARQFIEDLTVPIAALVAGPLVDDVLEPWMADGKGGADLFGWMVGSGAGAGMALVFVVIGVLGVLVAIVGFAMPTLRNIETILPDYDEVEPAPGYPRDASLPALFEEWADRTPAAPALHCDGRELSYGELDKRANRLAHHLRDLGVGPEGRVGLCFRSTDDWVVGALATLKAGAAYVPLDPAYPEERIASMCADARLSALLLSSDAADSVPDGCGTRVVVDELSDELAHLPATRPALEIHAESLAYVMYTSGSTGRPKGVEVTHRNVVRLVRDTNYIDIAPADAIAQASNISFDAATFEAWGALLNGARLVGIGLEDLLVPERLRRQLLDHEISIMFLTTSLARQLAADAPETVASVRHLAFGGERADEQMVLRLRAACPDTELVNAYGPTEGTTYTTTYRCDGDGADIDGGVPIGYPIANTTTYVLDDALAPVPDGEVGELYIGGDGVARGYLDRPDVTAECFLADPFAAQPGGRMYRSGDLVRRRDDGALMFVGRADDQVKVRGFRVEPGEIEHCLRASGLVRDVVVRADVDGRGDTRLVAWVVPAAGRDVDGVRDFARAQLPDYMLPSAFVAVGQLPLNANGKIDLAALPAPPWRAPGDGERVAPRTETERILAGIWCEVLGVGVVGVEDNFYELGGRSLLATRVRSRLSEALGVDVPLRTVLELPTVAALASAADGLAAQAPDAPVAAGAAEGTLADLLDLVEREVEGDVA
jgi:amino acid adenylation domain-containing protein